MIMFIVYNVIKDNYNNGLGYSKCISKHEKDLFTTKEDLLNSLKEI